MRGKFLSGIAEEWNYNPNGSLCKKFLPGIGQEYSWAIPFEQETALYLRRGKYYAWISKENYSSIAVHSCEEMSIQMAVTIESVKSVKKIFELGLKQKFVL